MKESQKLTAMDVSRRDTITGQFYQVGYLQSLLYSQTLRPDHREQRVCSGQNTNKIKDVVKDSNKNRLINGLSVL